MKKIYNLLMIVCGILLFTSCNDTETYSDLKEAERDAINRYISTKGIKVISQSQFTSQG